jgi:hypothetical protein
MTTRHTSADNDYPFVPLLEGDDVTIVGGILDLYFIVTGQPDLITGESSSAMGSSSAAPCPEDPRKLVLTKYSIVGAVTEFYFTAYEGSKQWDIVFEVPNSAGVQTIGSVTQSSGNNVEGVLIFDSDKILSVSTGSDFPSEPLEVEPGRTQWHTEQVDTLTFLNITRCNGVENSDSLEVVLAQSSSSGAFSLDLENGYNCEVSYTEEDGVQFIGALGLGKGVAPDLGNTEECSSSPTNLLDEIITTINGLAPVEGDIPLATSPGLAIERSPGQITIIRRR